MFAESEDDEQIIERVHMDGAQTLVAAPPGRKGGVMSMIQPELWVDRGAAAVDFYTSAFGARVLHRVGEGEDIVAQAAGR